LKACGHPQFESIRYRDQLGFDRSLAKKQSQLCRECWKADRATSVRAVASQSGEIFIVSVWCAPDHLKQALKTAGYIAMSSPSRFVLNLDTIEEARAAMAELHRFAPTVEMQDNLSKLWISDAAREFKVPQKYLAHVAEALDIPNPMDDEGYTTLSHFARVYGNRRVIRDLTRSVPKRERKGFLDTLDLDGMDRKIYERYVGSPAGRLPRYKTIHEEIIQHSPDVKLITVKETYYRLRHKIRHERMKRGLCVKSA
jgi:hypothetical protein